MSNQDTSSASATDTQPAPVQDGGGDDPITTNNSVSNGQERDLSNWLPITASRKAKWWSSTFHNVTAMVGAGVLGLPFAMSQLGWIPGTTMMVISWLLTFYSLWQMIEMHEMVPGKRFDRYHELGQYAFGEKLGYWIVVPQQLIVQVASNLVYMVTGGKSLKKGIELTFPSAVGHHRTTYYILVFCFLQLVLSQTPNVNSLKPVSFLAALMSLSYSMISFVASAIHVAARVGPREVDYGLRAHTTAGIVFEMLNGIGEIAFAYAGHSVVLEIQATIPSTPEKPSKKPMWKGVIGAYIVVFLCYFLVAGSGYWAYGNKVEDDILISLEHPPWLIAAANFMVFIHVIGSYQIYAMPIFDTLEGYLVKDRKFNPSRALHLIARSIYVALTALVAMCIPFFGGLMGFFGGLVFASTSYFLPCIIWLRVHHPPVGSWHWFASWVTIVVGVTIAVLAPIGGMRHIIESAKTYKFFS